MHMVAIEVDQKDAGKVFGILLKNGRFTGFSENKFRIDENPEEALKRFRKAKIDVKVIN